MQSSISLGIEFILPIQHLIKQALCALPLPCGKCLRQSRVLSPWAAQAAGCEFFMVTAHVCFSSAPRLKSGCLAYNIPCVSSPGAAVISHDKTGYASSTHSNGKIKGLCAALPGCENCISPFVPNEAKPCLLLTSKPSDHPGNKGTEAIFPQQCVLCCRDLTPLGRLTM